MVTGLCRPDCVELEFEMGTDGIELVFSPRSACRVPRTNAFAIPMSLPEELAESAAICFFHHLLEMFRCPPNCSFFLFFGIGFPIGFEPATLIEMEQCPSEMMQR